MRKLLLLALPLVLIAASISHAKTPHRKQIPLPEEYGRVVISNYSEKAGIAPAVFDHWLHRSMYTCRLCHIDIGFAMQEDGTDIKAADNMRGYYCGACHNGKTLYGDKVIFESCASKVSKEDFKRCERCHSLGMKGAREIDFHEFASKLPKGRLGNRIDWEAAELTGAIKPVDYMEGISIKRPVFKSQSDFVITPKGGWMSDIIFSHEKHTFWNGCEVCHPAIYGVKRGGSKFTMTDISNGQSCGVCHNSVAFPLFDCQRCHTKAVQ